MRHNASLLVPLLAATAVVPFACSLAVSSELDGKPSESDTQHVDAGDGDVVEPDAEVGDADASEVEAGDDANDADATEAGEVGPGCISCPDSCCNGLCADLENDRTNCGQCGLVCPANRDCTTGQCTPGFVATSQIDAPAARTAACAVWTGEEMFVWGGVDAAGAALDSGAAYDPATDKWREVKPDGAPWPREKATCVMTDMGVFVWGGVDMEASVSYADGAIWDPDGNEWSPVNAADGPLPRINATALWTGTEVLIWGGEHYNDAHQEKSGGRYDPHEELWSAIDLEQAPEHAKRQAWAWTGELLYVFGGRDDGGGHVYKDMHSYSPKLNEWIQIPSFTTPAARSNAFAVWTGETMLMWGGFDVAGLGLADGASFDPKHSTWTAFEALTPPVGRGQELFRSGWSAWIGDKMLIAGGTVGLVVHSNLSVFDPAGTPTSAWSPPQPFGSGVSHEGGVGVWTGLELIVWGGSDGIQPTVSGTRWMP